MRVWKSKFLSGIAPFGRLQGLPPPVVWQGDGHAGAARVSVPYHAPLPPYMPPAAHDDVSLVAPLRKRKRTMDCDDVDALGLALDDHDLDTDALADVANIDLLSDLFTVFENEQTGVDAAHVDDVAAQFDALVDEDAAQDAGVVDEISALFASLENDHDSNVADDLAGIFDDQDATAVDEISDLFDSLEDADFGLAAAADEAAAFHVDDVADLFTCLAATSPPRAAPMSPPRMAPALDARVPMPSMLRIDSRVPMLGALPRVGAVGGFVCGPPVPQKTVLSREDRVLRWKEKRRHRTTKDKPVFESRQQVAAKRRRVNGRFAGLETQFLSISSLQN